MSVTSRQGTFCVFCGISGISGISAVEFQIGFVCSLQSEPHLYDHLDNVVNRHSTIGKMQVMGATLPEVTVSRLKRIYMKLYKWDL